MFHVVELPEGDKKLVSVIHSHWLTPRKEEVYWPPYKTQNKFNSSLRVGEEPDEDSWALHSVSKILYATGTATYN